MCVLESLWPGLVVLGAVLFVFYALGKTLAGDEAAEEED